ncbi:MAG TPA: amidohydrolase family protein [Gaiellaceae bacterium]|nr:amidohydrolase family protein [Gaiellaceae bacterium]
MTTLDRAQSILDDYEELLRAELPEGAVVYDAHTHLGHDIDGSHGNYDELVDILDRHGIARAFTFCLDEHDRVPGFTVPNDRTLAHAERSQGRLVPFVRLDLTAQPLEEARRCLDLGARGIKLHPRAQAFALDDQRLGPIFELAVERAVPILIHGGRGLPPIAVALSNLVDRYVGVRLIIAHAGIADMADLTARLGGAPGVFFDTSVWSAIDLLDLFRQVAAEQIVYASDYPYGRQPNSLLLSIRAARLAGVDDRQLRAILGENSRRIADGEEPAELTTPRGGSSLVQPLTFARIHQYISMAVPLLWLRQRDAIGALGLAVNASRERDGHEEEAWRVQELLVVASELWHESVDIESDDERITSMRKAIQLVNLADLIAVTTRA